MRDFVWLGGSFALAGVFFMAILDKGEWINLMWLAIFIGVIKEIAKDKGLLNNV